MNTFSIVDRPSEDIVIPLQGLRFAIMETTIQERIRLWDAGPSDSFGPLSGDLPHVIDEYIRVVLCQSSRRPTMSLSWRRRS